MPAGPLPLGFAYFVGVKCIGYVAAAYVIRRTYKETQTGPVKIGVTRTAIGIGAGLVYGAVWMLLMFLLSNSASRTLYGYLYMAGLFPVRMGEWLWLIHLFFDRSLKNKSKAVRISIGGTVWSCCLDAIGIASAFVIPGGFWVC